MAYCLFHQKNKNNTGAQRCNTGLILCLLGLLIILTACNDSSWNADVAVMVGDEIIEQKAVNSILELGFYPFLADGEKADGAVSMKQILEKLIDEKLLLMEAKACGLKVEAAEIEALAQQLKPPWGSGLISEEEETQYRTTLHNQLLLRKITEKIIAENLELDAAAWEKFWQAWPKGEKGHKFRVRALITTNKPLIAANSLDAVVEDLQNNEDFVLSEPFWLSEKNLSVKQSEALNAAWQSAGKIKVSTPEKINSGWVVYEVLEVKPHDAVSEVALAQKAFEAQAAELAFQRWLQNARQRTTIKINPAFNLR